MNRVNGPDLEYAGSAKPRGGPPESGFLAQFLGHLKVSIIATLVLAVIESFSILIPGWRGSLVNLLAFTLLVTALVLLPGGIASLLERRGKTE